MTLFQIASLAVLIALPACSSEVSPFALDISHKIDDPNAQAIDTKLRQIALDHLYGPTGPRRPNINHLVITAQTGSFQNGRMTFGASPSPEEGKIELLNPLEGTRIQQDGCALMFIDDPSDRVMFFVAFDPAFATEETARNCLATGYGVALGHVFPKGQGIKDAYDIYIDTFDKSDV